MKNQNHWKIVSGILALLITIGLAFHSTYSRTGNNCGDIIYSDTSSILINDKLLLLDLKKNNQSKIQRIEDNYRDTTINKKEVIKLFNENFHANESLVDSILNLKNNNIFPFKVDYYGLKSKRLNVYAIILIVTFSGALGGFARTKYALLEDLLEKLEVVKQSVNGVLPEENAKDKNKLNSDISELKESIEKAKNEDNEKVYVNIIFGIIASSLSFLALTTFNSKVLDFKSEIDYFIFLSWCLLGAVFAKNWIKSLYNRVTNIK